MYSPRTNVTTDDVIAAALGNPGRATMSARHKAKAPVVVDINDEEISRIKRTIKKTYKREFNKRDSDRILEAIEHLRINYPGILLPMSLLFYMCSPGPDFLGSTHNDVLLFARKVSRYRNAMLLRFGTSFYRMGHSKTHSGFFRAYIDKKELAKYESGKYGKNLKNAYAKAETLSAAIGKVEELKVGADFTQAQKEETRDYLRIVANIGQLVKGYLPAAPPKPSTPKPTVSE